MSGLLKFITCGSVDDGKSTLIGHILYDAKLLYADQEKALELDSKVGSREGAIDYSLLLDGLMAEREQGITIDVAYRYFTTDNRSFIVADTPGHEEYTFLQWSIYESGFAVQIMYRPLWKSTIYAVPSSYPLPYSKYFIHPKRRKSS